MDDFDNAFDEADISEETEVETVADEGTGEAVEPETVEAAPDEAEQVAEDTPQETAEPTITPPVMDDDAVDGRIQAVMAIRDEKKAAIKRAELAESQLKQLQQTQSAPKDIDPYDDPQGFQQQQTQARLEMRAEFSEEMARVQHGTELVDEAQAWWTEQIASNPIMKAQLTAIGQQKNPYASIVSQFKQHKLVAEIGGDPEAYKANLRAQWEAEQGIEPTAAIPVTPTPSAKAVPPSLAKGGGNTGAVTTNDADDFNSVFN